MYVDFIYRILFSILIRLCIHYAFGQKFGHKLGQKFGQIFFTNIIDIIMRDSMSWFFGLGIPMSWYMCLHGLVFVIIVKTKKITHNYVNYVVNCPNLCKSIYIMYA